MSSIVLFAVKDSKSGTAKFFSLHNVLILSRIANVLFIIITSIELYIINSKDVTAFELSVVFFIEMIYVMLYYKTGGGWYE